MRYAALIILLWLPGILAAQSWNIAVNGGIVLNTKTSKPSENEQMAKGPGGVAGLQASYTRNRWEAGLGVAFRRYAVRIEGDYYFEDDFDPLTGTFKSGHHLRFLETFPAIAITPFINRHFGAGRADWYTGLSVGYAVMLQKQISTLPPRELLRSKAYDNGFTAGIHAGCAYRLWKRWSLRGELSADCLWLKAFSLQDVIVTAGLQYRIR